MAINRVSPGIEIREFDRSIVARQPNRPIGAISGIFTKGPVGVPTLVRTESELVSNFGEPTNANEETFFTAASYLAYSDQLYVIRVANNALSSYAKPTIQLDTLSIVTQSGAFTNSDVITISGANTITTANISVITDSNGKITNYAIVNAGVFNSSDFPVGTNGLLNVIANNQTTGSTSLTFNVTYKPVATANQQAISINTKVTTAGLYDDTDWRGKIGYDGYSSDTNLLFISKTAADDLNGYRVSIVDSDTAFLSSLLTAFNTASANVVFIQGATSANIQTASASAANTLATKFGYRDIFHFEMNISADASKPKLTADYNITGKKVVGSNVVLTFAQAITHATTLTIYANTTTFYTGTGGGLQKGDIRRRWEFAGGGFPIFTYTDKTITNNILDTVYIAIVDKNNNLVSSITGSRVLSNKGLFSGKYYVDLINKYSKHVWWANHIPGLTTSTDPKTLLASTQTVPFNAFLGAGSNLVTEDNVSLATLLSGYDQLKDKTAVNVDVILTGKSVGGFNGEGLTNYIIDNICEQRKDCIVFSSPQLDDLTSDSNDANYNKMIAFSDTVLNSSFCFLDSGYKVMYDRYRNRYVNVPLNGDVAGLYVRTINRLGPWWSPAGFNRGELRNLRNLYYNPGELDRDQLYPASINPVVQFPGQDAILFGDKTTLNQGSAFDHLNVRGLFIYLEKVIADVSKFTLFEFNDEFTRARFIGQVDPILRDVKGRRGIYDYRLICDETNNTPDIIDANGFVADIYIKPARSINFIQLNFVAMATGMEFNEIIGQFEI
jgi:hypothetical protein